MQQQAIKQQKSLPHLPKSMVMSKPLPSANWNDDSNAGNDMGMPSPQGRHDQYREQQPTQQTSSLQRRAQPEEQHQQNQALSTRSKDAADEPPVFMAQPPSNFGLSRRGSVVQQQVYRMDGGIHPVDLLSQRLHAWKYAIKDLTKLFMSIEDIETKSASQYSKSSKDIVVPFPEGQGQFMQSGGIQEVWLAFRNYTVEQSVRHQDYVNYIDRSVLPSLRNIKNDIKALLKYIGRDKDLRTNNLYDDRRRMDTLVSKLDRIIQADSQMADRAYQHPDPLLVNCAVFQANKQLIDDENALHENIVNLQDEVHLFEQNLVENIRDIAHRLQNFRMEKLESRKVFGQVTATLNTITRDTEWNEFVRRNAGNLISDKAAYKTDQDISYPNQNHDLVQPIKVGLLERKSGLMRNWTEGLYVLTPAGFLHSYKSTRQFDADPQSPEVSIFVPHTNVDSNQNYDSMYQESCFEIRGKNAQAFMGVDKSFTLRAQDPSDLQDWFNKLVQVSERFRPMPLMDQQQDDQQQERALPPLPSNDATNRTTSQQLQVHPPQQLSVRQHDQGQQHLNQGEQQYGQGQQQQYGQGQQQYDQGQQQYNQGQQQYGQGQQQYGQDQQQYNQGQQQYDQGQQQFSQGQQQQYDQGQQQHSQGEQRPQVIQVPVDRIQVEEESSEVVQTMGGSHDGSDEARRGKGKEPVPLPKDYDDDDEWDTVPQHHQAGTAT